MQQKIKHKSIYFYLAVLAVFLGICSPHLFTHGMFLDGVTYAAIAKNMALGKGSFWILHYTDTLHYPVFYEQPPLALWIQSVFFRIFGTGIFVERFYSVFTLILTGFLMIKIWKEIVSETVTAWFPLLLFILFPIITWTATNNLLENTMMIFICCSVFFYLKGTRNKKYYFTILSGLSLFAGVLCKGIVACFPLTIPFWIWLFFKKISFKQVLQDTLILVICTLLPLILLYVSSVKARFFFDNYLSNQLFASVTGLRETAESRFFILKSLLENSIICLVLTAGICIVQIVKKRTILMKEQISNSLLFLSLSLCGILPVLLSLKQSGFYIIPAYPFLAIAFALPLQPFIKGFMEKINSASKGFFVFKTLICILLASSVLFSFSQKGKIERDKKELQLVFECGKYISPNTTINIDKEIYHEYYLHAYFARYKNISLDANADNRHLFYLHNQDFPLPSLEDEYVPLTEIDNFILLKKK